MTFAEPVSLAAGRPLTPMQLPLWLSQRRHPDLALQNMVLLTHIDGPVDPGRLVSAFAGVVAASDALRTRIVEHGGRPRVHLDPSPPPSVIDRVRRCDVHEWAIARARVPIDLGTTAYDSVICVHEDNTASWYLALHHAVTDASSSALVFAATARVYHGAEIELPSYYRWAADLKHPRHQRSVDHWAARRRPERVPRLYRASAPDESSSARVAVPLDDRVRARLVGGFEDDSAMMSPELAWSAALMTATTVLLRHVAGIEECSIGLPVHNRATAVADDVIGTVMEVFPTDVSVELGDTYRSLNRRVGRALLTTLRNSAPGTAPPPDAAALVNVIPRARLGNFGPYATTTQWIPSGTIDPGHLLRVQLTSWDESAGERPTLLLDINRSAADADHLARAPEHFARILTRLVDEPDLPVSSPILTTDERVRLSEWESADDFDTPTPGVVDQLRAALANRDEVSLRHGERALTGRQLWGRVEATARWLRSRGVGSGDRVAVDMPRSEDAVIAIIAILVAGGSFVPLEVCDPSERRRRLVERARCRLVVTELAQAAEGTASLEPVAHRDGDEAYVIFTSGSTGEPKGVPITHEGLARYLRFAVGTYALDHDPLVAPLYSSLAFDLTITSLFVPLLVGGELVVVDRDGSAAIATVASERRITWCKATPSHLEILLRLLPDGHRLRTIVVGGEAFTASLAQRLLDASPGVRLFNEYGPTEAVVGCMVHRVEPGQLARHPDVPIGRPAPGVTLRVVGPEFERVPIGAVGELWISHPGLTGGYIGDPSSTSEADRAGSSGGSPFIELDDRRFYRSGDLVRLVDATTLAYVGRRDDQIKLGGIRLEPGEVESAIESHPSIRRAIVRPWRPRPGPVERRCERCGLASNVPGIRFDDAGVCSSCHDYDRIAPQAEQWFKSVDDLVAKRNDARSRRRGPYDCVHLLSGGKDSTYALYQLVELGFEPLALTLDNGYLSEGAKTNIARSVADLGIAHEWATTDSMELILRTSLERHSDVCHGCYKALYTLATSRAVELGIPMIVTGLSRGQLFETRLIPRQFDADRFDPDAIDRAVVAARKTYHRADDGVNRLLDSDVFDTDEVFEQVEYLDFYRYVDVELRSVLDFLTDRAPWVRPHDTGRSTNCLINVAGIHTHQQEQGYHNYAVPYAWDVRLGHKTRAEAIDELEDEIDLDEVGRLLGTVGYIPSANEILTAWVELAAGHGPPSPAALRAALAELLPAHAIPRAIVPVSEIPLTVNGKVDTSALPRPERAQRVGTGPCLAPETVTERRVIEIWEAVLRVEPIGLDDDFFALGGDSLAALHMIAAVDDVIEPRPAGGVSDAWAFEHPTPRSLAARIDASALATGPAEQTETTAPAPVGKGPLWTGEPPLSSGEVAVLSDQGRDPRSHRYRIAQLFHVAGPVDERRFVDALRRVAQRHVPLSWSYGVPRKKLALAQAVDADVRSSPVDVADLDEALRRFHLAPFDLETGPLLRCLVQPVSDGTTAVLLVCHHVSIDEHSFDVIWRQIDADLRGVPVGELGPDYASYAIRRAGQAAEDRAYWSGELSGLTPSRFEFHPPRQPEGDGFLTRTARVRSSDLRVLGGVTPLAGTLAALVATLRRYADGDTIEIGTIATIRDHHAAESVVGFLLNTLPVPLECRPDEPLVDVARRASRSMARHLAHRACPAADIRRDRQLGSGHPPNVDVALAYREWRPVTLEGVAVRQRALSNGSSVNDATFFVEVHDGRVELSIEYRGGVIGSEVAGGLLANFEAMLHALVRRPAATVGEVELPAGGERLLGPEIAPVDSLMTEILGNVDSRDVEPAVVCGGRTMSWRDLGDRSEELAAQLRAAGVAPGDRVVVELCRSVDVVVAAVAILRLGAAYVPVDPAGPPDRRAHMAASVGARVKIVSADPATGGGSTLDIEVTDHAAARATPRSASEPGIAYVMFTSGSTGQPRAVPVAHVQLAASTVARRAVYDRTPQRFLVASNPSFDSSIAGIFWTLMEGGTIVFPTDDEVRDPDRLVELIGSAGVSDTLMVPTLYQAVLERAGSRRTAWPSRVIVAGESCPRWLVRRHLDRWPDSELFNEYGPTETTVWATVHRCRAEEGPVPIGMPVPGVWAAVVDGCDRLRPPGVEGELIVGGAGVVDGYLDDPSTTTERFDTGQWGRFFRTGDRAVVLGSELVFLGRLDHRLNVGGARVEPEEVERVLIEDADVASAIVTAHDPRTLGELVSEASPHDLSRAMLDAARTSDPAGELTRRLRSQDGTRSRLVAHVEPVAGHQVDVEAVRRLVASRLPATMRPSAYAVHPALPRSPNGKLDRVAARELPIGGRSFDEGQWPAGGGDAGRAAPGDDLVAWVAQAFATVLGLDRVDGDESFFDVGGHSLLALELVLRLQRALGLDVSVSMLYDHPSAVALVGAIRNRSDWAGGRPILVPIQPHGERIPIFGVHVLGVDSAFYRPLARHLGDEQPLFGLGQPTSMPDTTGPTDVVDVARTYATEIGRVAPVGPVVLAAVSLGAVVAFELARQLRDAGRDVAQLVLFDAVGPDAHLWSLTPRERITVHLREARRRPRAYLAARTERLRVRFERRRQILALRVRRALGLRLAPELLVRAFIEKNWRSQAEYRFTPYDGAVLAFKAGDDPFTASLADHGLGWESVVWGPLDVEVVPGDHLSMLAEPSVARVAQVLESALARLHRDADATIEQSEIERDLVSALAGGHFAERLDRWLSTDHLLSPAARELLGRCDRVARTISSETERRGGAAVDALIEAGIEARLLPVPPRAAYGLASLRVEDPSSTRAPLDRAVRALERSGYRVERGTGPGFAGPETPSRIGLLSTDDPTFRVVLEAGGNPPVGVGRGDGTLAPSPHLATPGRLVERLLTMVAPTPDDLVLDLGCGDGRVLVEAARRHGCRGWGVESDPGQVDLARARIAEARLQDRIVIEHTDIRRTRVEDASIVFVFLPAELAREIVPWVLGRLRPGARLLAHEQVAQTWQVEPDRSALLAEDGITVAHLWHA